MTRFGVLVTVMCATVPAHAAEWRSAYTDVDLAECTMISTYELGASWACPGWRGFPLLISEGDLRLYVSYGFGAEDEIVSRQTLASFNWLGPRLEWLIAEDQVLGPVPKATILRYHLDPPEPGMPEGQVLVVTQIERGNSCHVAYVDARANENANSLARTWAERLAGTVDCETTEPQIIGEWTAY